MRIRIIDYVGNLGGGVRFVGELLRALRTDATLQFELVSHGAALERYRSLIDSPNVVLREVAPLHASRNVDRRLFNIPGSGRVLRALGLAGVWHFELAPELLDAEVVWFPWIHRHRLPQGPTRHVVGSLHDLILMTFPNLARRGIRADENETIRGWLNSSAQVVTTAHATNSALSQRYGVPTSRMHMVPLSGEHARPAQSVPIPKDWAWAAKPFLLCPANTLAHKDHETLLRGVGRWGAKMPLVLTGDGTDLPESSPRGRALRALAKECGLRIGETLMPLGYLPDALYLSLLRASWALVMPTLAEGGGSFPVLEAMLAGVPVLTTSIPVIVEQLSRVGGEVMWFSPGDAKSLQKVLQEFEMNADAWRRKAQGQIASLHIRAWREVAADYDGLWKRAATSLGAS